MDWECGRNLGKYGRAESETDDPPVPALRRRQAKNFIAILMISQGVPMPLAGDEIWRTQHGNNKAGRQDNEFSWFDLEPG